MENGGNTEGLRSFMGDPSTSFEEGAGEVEDSIPQEVWRHYPEQQEDKWALNSDPTTSQGLDMLVDRKDLWSQPPLSMSCTVSMPVNNSVPAGDLGDLPDIKMIVPSMSLMQSSGPMNGGFDVCTRPPAMNCVDNVVDANSMIDFSGQLLNSSVPGVPAPPIMPPGVPPPTPSAQPHMNAMDRMAAPSSMPGVPLSADVQNILGGVAPMVPPPRRQRSVKKPIPDEEKDERYFERRKRNNEAARKSRQARKGREEAVMIQTSHLQKSTDEMKILLAHLDRRRKMLMQYATKRTALLAGEPDVDLTIHEPELEFPPFPEVYWSKFLNASNRFLRQAVEQPTDLRIRPDHKEELLFQQQDQQQQQPQGREHQQQQGLVPQAHLQQMQQQRPQQQDMLAGVSPPQQQPMQPGQQQQQSGVFLAPPLQISPMVLQHQRMQQQQQLEQLQQLEQELQQPRQTQRLQQQQQLEQLQQLEQELQQPRRTRRLQQQQQLEQLQQLEQELQQQPRRTRRQQQKELQTMQLQQPQPQRQQRHQQHMQRNIPVSYFSNPT